MPPDVSVIIPAYDAFPLIQNAVQSVVTQAGLTTEVVIAADDHLDYGDLLHGTGIDLRPVVICRTQTPQSGPATARNLAVEAASSAIIAPLDADDVFAPDRLRLLLAEVDRHGVATGSTVERNMSGQRLRVARAAEAEQDLGAERLCTVRMPFFPVFHRQFYGDGWPDVAFAEDLVFNLSLLNQTGTYPFVEDAQYLYLQHADSLSNGTDSVLRARRGYEQILQALDTGEWNWKAHIAEVLYAAISEDLTAVNAHLEQPRVPETSEWRDVVRALHHEPDENDI